MRNIRLIVEYDGSDLAGWQRQADRPTVQGHLEEALARIIGEKITVIGAGRTDAGVHARGQTANFKTSSLLSSAELLRGANAMLPEQIAVLAADDVYLDFHSRYDAKSKIYDYDFYISPVRPVLRRAFVWHQRPGLDLAAMSEALTGLIGEKDFAAFQSTGSSVKSTVRRMLKAELVQVSNEIVRITLEADGFLRHMVRAIAGTLVIVGRGGLSPVDFTGIVESGDRSRAGATAPARGLCLREVRY